MLSIAHRITGVISSIGAFGLVAWLAAAASGEPAWSGFRSVIASLPGQSLLAGFSFAFFLHLCAGIRHLVWDSVHGFELRTIYVSGWAVVFASLLLTAIAWAISFFMVI